MNVRSLEGIERLRCPFCGCVVLNEAAESLLHHEEPVCDAFKEKMKTMGMSAVPVERAMWLQPGPEKSRS
jgi:hypothetical protein